MVFDAKRLFRALGSDDDEQKAALAKLLATGKAGSVEIVPPPTAAPMDIPMQPRPLDTPPTAPAQPTYAPAIGRTDTQEPEAPYQRSVLTPVQQKMWRGNPIGTEMGQARAMNAARDQNFMANVAPRYGNIQLADPNIPNIGTGRDYGPLQPNTEDYATPPPPGQYDYEHNQPGALQRAEANARTSGDIAGLADAIDRGEYDSQFHKHSLLGRLFRGLGRGWKNWQPGEGLFGLANMVGEGVESAASSQHDIEAQRQGAENRLFRRLGAARQQEGFEGKQQTELAKAANYQNEILNRNAATIANAAKEQRAQLNQEQELLWKSAYGVADTEFDPDDPANAGLVGRMRAAGVPIRRKRKGTKFQPVQTQNGDLKAFNPDDGSFEDKGNFAKPASINDNDLPDELFAPIGLISDKEVSDRAAASVGKLPEGRRLRPEQAERLAGQFHEKGSTNFSENQYWAARMNGDTDIPPSDIYENLPSDYEQRVAGARNKIRDSQKDLRTKVAQFRSALKTYRPNANAAGVSLTDVVGLFNDVMRLPADQRKAALKKFYEKLPMMRIQ